MSLLSFAIFIHVLEKHRCKYNTLTILAVDSLTASR